MQRSWLRLLVSAVILVAALSASAANAFAPHAHACAEMAVGSDCPDADGDHGALPRPCDTLLCGAIQLTPVFVLLDGAAAPSRRLAQPRDDLLRVGLVGPPDLRPPIS